MVRKGNNTLRAEINGALGDMEEDGTQQRLRFMSFRACGPRNLMKVVSVTVLFSAPRSRLSTQWFGAGQAKEGQ